MVDRVSASITIGGSLPLSLMSPFTNLIAAHGLSVEWDGEPFAPSQCTTGSPLVLMAHEVAHGHFGGLEDICIGQAMPFVRWSGGCAGSGAQRAVFDGTSDLRCYVVDEEDTLLLDHASALDLGSFEAIRTWFDHADFAVPPLVIVQSGEETSHG